MKNNNLSPLFVWLLLLPTISSPAAGDDLEPGDPIAAIDGEPVLFGELNLVLTDRLQANELQRVGAEVRRATAALVVRRHLAMKSLEAKGGPTLEAMLKRQVETLAADLRRRGSSLQKQAADRMADEASLVTDLRWRLAWGQYLKSRLNDANLKRFFGSHRSQYAGGRWEVSQIFVKADKSDVASWRATLANVNELADQIRVSETPQQAFYDAAIEHSESASASDGGKVGWVQKDGDLPGTLMTAIRKMKTGQVSKGIQSPLGIHLVLLHQIEAGDLQFEDLTDQAQLRRDAANALFDALLRERSGTQVSWLVRDLKPPADLKMIPE
ncbi:peptidylprolyl isomerase [bacterium]|nr:peptidylprolyl isomerase [bacterium]